MGTPKKSGLERLIEFEESKKERKSGLERLTEFEARKSGEERLRELEAPTDQDTMAGRIVAAQMEREGTPFARGVGLRDPASPVLRELDRFVGKPLDAFAEETFRSLTFQPTVGAGQHEGDILGAIRATIPEASAAFRKRPIAAQLAIGLGIDPGVLAVRAPGAAARLSPTRFANVPQSLLADRPPSIQRAVERAQAFREGVARFPDPSIKALPARAESATIPMSGQVSTPPTRGPIPPAPVENVLVVVTPQNPRGVRLTFAGPRAMNRAAQELAMMPDRVQVLPSTASVDDVDRAARQLPQAVPPGAEGRNPITRWTAGGEVRPRQTQRQLSQSLDPEDLNQMRRTLRSVEHEINTTPPGPKPNRPVNQRLRALLEGQAEALRVAIRDTLAPTLPNELDIPGVIRREPVQRFFVSSQTALPPGHIRPQGMPAQQGTTATRTRPSGIPIEASTPEEAARLRAQVREQSLPSQAGEVTTDIVDGAPVVNKTIDRAPVQQTLDAPLATSIDIQDASRVTSDALGPAVIVPSENSLNLFGLHPLEAGLGKLARLKNSFREMITRKTGISTTQENQFATVVIHERRRVRPIIQAQAKRLNQMVNAALHHGNLRGDKDGLLPNLSGIDPSIRGAPTVSDVAARLPLYLPHLSARQIEAFEEIRVLLAPFRQATDEIGESLASRPDVLEGGFYIPRARRSQVSRVAGRLRRRPEPGFKQEIEFPSQAFGVSQGIDYLPVEEAVKRYATQVGTDTLDAHSVKFLLKLVDDGVEGVATNTIDIPRIQGTNFDVEMANAINAELRAEGTILNIPIISVFNSLYRSFRSTLDNSSLGIQGLLGLSRNPVAFGRALRTNIRAWWSGGERAFGEYAKAHDLARQPGMPTVQQWNSSGLSTQGAAGEFGLEGTASITERVGQLPGVRQANRAFGTFGDTLRVAWADAEFTHLWRQGITPDSAEGRAAMEKIAKFANGGTGVAQGRALGDVGEILLFAPRFLQSRLETTARAVMGLRPGATLEQRIARRSMLQFVGIGTGLTFAANELLGQDTDTRPYIKIKTGTKPSAPYINPETGRERKTRDVYELVPNSNFMRVRYGGRDWSFFGTWDSLARVIMAGAVGDPIGALRPLSSGSVSVGVDLITGEGFLGEDVPRSAQAIVNQPEAFASWLGGQVFPFAAEEIPSAVKRTVTGDPGGGVATIIGEIIGAKSSPLNKRERRNVIAKDLYRNEYDDLTSTEKANVRELNDE